MRILVHEYLTGGGLLDEPQLAALAPEGEAMVRALLHDLAAVPGIEAAVTRDHRLGADLPAAVLVVVPGEGERALHRAIDESDAVWPIAPESDGILLRIVRQVRARRRRCLASESDTIAIASSKLATAASLEKAGVPVIPTHADLRLVPPGGRVVSKLDDGAGCQQTRLFDDRAALAGWLEAHNPAGLVFQPYVTGEARSLSAIFCNGRARLLAVNRQQVMHGDGLFRFDGVIVNAVEDRGGRYAALAGEVAKALPGLWGYCGIDFIETIDGPVVVEVNPRLTTSYVGLRDAIGVNPAALVLALPESIDASRPTSDGR